ncbi:DUF58 domain-containing protein [Oceanobacter mangrovi]|uniref:DUF58 domain-containing protein n=1 Tax=Oceanobacter mangrovi TaxID=2862510 RepID=UPI001C8E3067|nr:DUF58 domain-containing protein [Oceanobacter mangrovi]
MDSPQANQATGLLIRYLGGHRLLLLLAVASFLVAWNRGIALLYGMFTLVIALWLVSWLMPLLTLNKVQLTLRQLGETTVGGKLRLEYRFEQAETLAMLEVEALLPFAELQPSQRLAVAAAGDRLELECEVHQRGEFTVSQVRVGCSWPFGLKTHYRIIDIEPAVIRVYPERFRIRQLPDFASQMDDIHEHQFASQQFAEHEYAGLREHRHGDPLRKIHWAASARYQQLMVKEFDSYADAEFLLVLDTQPASNLGEAPRCSFELAVSIAASLMQWAQHHHMPMRLIAGGSRPIDCSVASHSGGTSDYMAALTAVQADGLQNYQQEFDRALLLAGQRVIGISIRNNSQLPELPAWRGAHLDIRLEDQSFIYPLQSYPEGWQSLQDQHAVMAISANSQMEALFRHAVRVS